ncbi:cytochrome P450 [Mycobacterium sp. RTGN5]|uniref:cytochrome P450 n=1 Tax=Mycobacterium sp. RTGN5 TaxID=3016522 RepID=UPI0029C8D6C1|nr:cytochrome P450 [Mycobacterium sp. RTGN5]
MTTAALVFDPFSQEFFDNPYEIYDRMRHDTPVYYSEQYDFYALCTHRDVAAAFKDHATFSSAFGVDLAMVRAGGPPAGTSILQLMDPPDHRYMRSVLNKMFTPRAIETQRSMIAAIIDGYIAAIDGDDFDVVESLAAPSPAEVITSMLGVPEEYVQKFRLWSDISLHREPGQVEMSEEGRQANLQKAAVLVECLADHRAHPREDLFTLLIDADIERAGGAKTKLTDAEIIGFALQLGGAGSETVTKLLASAVHVFGREQDQWARLAADPDRIPAAIEELLRYDNPVQYDVRRSMKDVTIRGVTIPAHKPVFLLLAAANRDPDAWANADTFDIDRDRTESQNLGFGYGIHSCLGAALARMESRIALEKLLTLMPRYEVDWDGCARVHMANVVGWSRVPVHVKR